MPQMFSHIFTGGKWEINKSEENETNLRILKSTPLIFKDKSALSILSRMLSTIWICGPIKLRVIFSLNF